MPGQSAGTLTAAVSDGEVVYARVIERSGDSEELPDEALEELAEVASDGGDGGEPGRRRAPGGDAARAGGVPPA